MSNDDKDEMDYLSESSGVKLIGSGETTNCIKISMDYILGLRSIANSQGQSC